MTELARGMNAVRQRAHEILTRIEDLDNPIVIEVGVNDGRLSNELLKARKDITLYMVDSWLGTEDLPDAYKKTNDRNALRPANKAEQSFRNATRVAQTYPGRAKVIREDSVVAAGNFLEDSVDLIFIDADHSYEGVSRDIDAYLPVTNRWIGGHDYRSQQPQFDFSGVDRAVDERFSTVEVGMNLTWFVEIK